MKDVSHTNPYTGETTGHLFQRGPVVAADGGEREAADPKSEDGQNDERMRDVSHSPPNQSEDANRVFERGGREEADVGDEEEE